jgi:hypothetical protein
MVSYWHSGKKVIGQPDINCFVSKIKKEENNELEKYFEV